MLAPALLALIPALPLAFGTLAGSAVAESVGEGMAVVNAKTYHPLDRAAAIQVVPLNDTTLNLELHKRMLRELDRARIGVSEGAPLELTFDNEILQGSLQAASGPSLGRLDAGTATGVGRRSTETDVNVNVNVWSSTQDSVLGGRRSEAGKSTPSQFRIYAELQDRRSGTRIWEGDVRALLGGSDPARLGKRMVGPLVDALGEVVRHQAVELR